jgi:hypothetical protein
MNSLIIARLTQSLSLAANDRKLVLLVLTTTIFYASQEIGYPQKFLALLGWYVPILIRASSEQIRIKFYYWIVLIVIYQVCLTYYFMPN